MYDYHMHSSFSFDSEMAVEDIISTAKKIGLKEICITDHFDTDPINTDFHVTFDPAAFRKKIETTDTRGVNLKIGVELGLNESTISFAEDFIRGHKFDFIICSQHYTDGVDPFLPGYFDNRTLNSAYERHLMNIYDAVSNYSNFSVVGHIGYPAKYQTAVDQKSLEYEDYPDLLDSIFKVLIEQGNGIEVNTSSVHKLGMPMASYSVVKRFVQMGGEIITVGSDAHETAYLGRGIKDAIECLKEVGVKYICTFEDMKPIFNAI